MPNKSLCISRFFLNYFVGGIEVALTSITALKRMASKSEKNTFNKKVQQLISIKEWPFNAQHYYNRQQDMELKILTVKTHPYQIEGSVC